MILAYSKRPSSDRLVRLGLLVAILWLPGIIYPLSPAGTSLESRLEGAIEKHVTAGLRRANLSGEVAVVQLPANLGNYPPGSGIRPLRSFLPDKAAGRFIIPMEISPPNVRPVRIYATVETVALIHGWVAKMPLKRGDPLDEDKFKRTIARVSRGEKEYFSGPALPEGYQMSARLMPGDMLRYHHLEEAPAVKRGEAVTIYYIRNNITLVSPGKARRRGQLGDVIPVIAAVTGKQMFGRLDAPGIIVVE